MARIIYRVNGFWMARSRGLTVFGVIVFTLVRHPREGGDPGRQFRASTNFVIIYFIVKYMMYGLFKLDAGYFAMQNSGMTW